MLNILDNIPDGFLTASHTELHRILRGPSLIHLPGRREPALFVSVILHGNEPAGLTAVQNLLRKYQDRELPRALSIFIGNVAAAAENMRRLDGQADYNRIWLPGDAEENKMAMQVLDIMRDKGVFASIDVHNNTGLNPHYACVNRMDHRFFHLATLFNRTVVYFTKPEGVQTSAFADLCPAVTLECGQPHEARGPAHALELIEAGLHMDHIPDKPIAPHDIDLFHTVAIVKVPPDVSFCFKEDLCDINFADDIDHMNFRELPVNTTLGWLNTNDKIVLDARDEDGVDITARYFDFSEGEISTAQPVMPSMLTLDERVIRQDCLCYLMERVEMHDR